MHILLVRHGRTKDNATFVFQGQGGRGLDELGRMQARRLAGRLARHEPHAPRITAVVASDLERAVETATACAEALGLSVETDPGLREIDVGLWTGKSYREIEAAYPEEWAAWAAGLDVRRGGGETYAELAERIDRALTSIAERHPDGRVLVVSHGAAIRSWVSRLLGLGTEARHALGSVANTSITFLEHKGAEHAVPWRLHAWNDTAHLEGMDAEAPSD